MAPARANGHGSGSTASGNDSGGRPGKRPKQPSADGAGGWFASVAAAVAVVGIGTAVFLSGRLQGNAAPAPAPLPSPPTRAAAEAPAAKEQPNNDSSTKTVAAASKQWWRAKGVGFTHRHIIQVETSNFNGTMTNATDRPLLIAFYDPRSQSFKELKPKIVEIATAFATSFADAQGKPVAYMGACDVTVQTFLTRMQAPHFESGWQEVKKGAFKFGRPRFFPLIIMVYMKGKLWGEYLGVVSVEQVMKFLTRLQSAPAGEPLESAGAVQAFMTRPGPFAFGCGLTNGTNESSAFNETAHSLHGTISFGILGTSLCSEMFGPLEPPWPKVVWSRDISSDATALSKVVKISADTDVIGNNTKLRVWLNSHRASLLQEMTPDNSHVFLDEIDPLVVFLINPDDAKVHDEAEMLVAEIESQLEAEMEKERITQSAAFFQFGSGIDFNFVWSDCKVFGKQFECERECPVVLVVNPYTIDYEKIPLRDLQYPKTSEEKSKRTSDRLLLWLRNISDPWRPPRPNLTEASGTGGTNDTNNANGTNSETTDSEQPKEEEDDDDGDAPQPSEDPEWFSGAVPALEGDSPAQHFRVYHGLLQAMLDLKNSFDERYASTVDFDWSDLTKAQKLDRRMSMLVQQPQSIEKAFVKGKMKKLWARIEARVNAEWELREAWKNHTQGIATTPTKADKQLSAALIQGHKLLRSLFVRLFQELHTKAARGDLGPPLLPQQVERRDASSLSVAEFVDKYAKPGLPVIITGLNVTKDEAEWTLDFFKAKCNVTVALRMKNDSLKSWGKLQTAGNLNLPEFIDTFHTNETRKAWYLHDWSLPRGCPDVFGAAPYNGFSMPKYFAGDYFQRGAFIGYQHAWPSLFIGSNSTESAMHIDSGGTNFWLYLLSGKKEWKFYSWRDIINVYSLPLSAHFFVDVFSPNHTQFPLLKYAQLYEGIQGENELMFIPGGNPHGVRNLEHIHGISMNYVDTSNIWMYLWHQLADSNWESFEMFTDNISIPHGLRSDQEDMAFGEWKSTSWNDLTYDVF